MQNIKLETRVCLICSTYIKLETAMLQCFYAVYQIENGYTTVMVIVVMSVDTCI